MGRALAASKSAGANARSRVKAFGGAGGYAVNGDGGAGATVRNGAYGYTNYGALTPREGAYGGAGGASKTANPGRGGDAYAAIQFNDFDNPTRSASINASVTAIGGAAGQGPGSAGGGVATAFSDVEGFNFVTNYTAATGGAGTNGAGGPRRRAGP